MVTGSTPISQLPTGTIDNLLAAMPISVGMPSSPQTIRSPLLILRDYLLPPEYIDGLNVSYISTGSVSVGMGTAYIPSLNKAIHVTGAITVNSANPGSATSGTWSHLYLYESAGAATIEDVTTVPSAPYAGVARTKTGDTSRRWIGSLYHNANGLLYDFSSNVQGNVMRFNWITPEGSTVFDYPLISGTVTRDFSHLIPLPVATIELQAKMVFIMGANAVMFGALGERSDLAGNVDSYELYQRVASTSASNYGGTPTPMKISGATFKAVTSFTTGNGSMSVRVRGIAIQR